MSLHRYLARLIWICVSPLVLLAGYLGIDSVRTARSETLLEANNLAKNVAISIDQNLYARVGALQILASSPHADDASSWEELYHEAQEYHASFGSHVILADLGMHMLFNTRVPFGTPLPMLPVPKGRAAAPTAANTGKPAVGDIIFGPVAKEPLIAVAVPGKRKGKIAFILLSTFETQLFKHRLERVSLPSGWSLSLVDGNGEAIARRGPRDLNPAADVDDAGRFTAKSEISPWSVVLEIPRDEYRAPLVSAAAILATAILGATLAGVLGGMLASRQLASSVASLVEQPNANLAPHPEISEIAEVRRLLDEAAEKRATAEAARLESEQRFRATFEQAAVGISLVAPDGRWLRANQKLCDIVGYSHDELLGRSFQDITHPDDRGESLANVRRLLAGEIDTCMAEKRYVRKDGSTVWINVTAALVRRPDGSPDYVVSIIEDIQRRKEIETALKASQARLSFALQQSDIGAWDLNLADHTAYRTPTHDRIFGYKALLPQWTYEMFLEHVLPEDRAEVDRKFGVATATHADSTFDCRIRRADGETRWIQAAGGHEHDTEGRPLRMSGIVQDITERKRAEEAVRKLNERLEARVKERTAQLEAANQELDAFAYSASHDLRAPLQTINGFSRALQEDYGGKADPEARDYLERIRAASQRMAQLVDDLLRLSRITRAGMAHESVDLSALARSVADELVARDPARVVAVEIAEDEVVQGDRRLLRVLLDNLFANAWKFTSKLPRARIEFTATERNGERMYCVRDDGAGFDMAYAAKLFMPFQRLHSAADFPGNGVGLATVQRIVHRHGGRVWAEGAPGKGAAFYFTLSAAPGATSAAEPDAL